jgi:3-hydroxy-9,10-secoandrosta-1,3,5(10)-triene-9,17-dione monooxygenase reductase component
MFAGAGEARNPIRHALERVYGDGPMIHDDDPFADPLSERDPVRRFRGRLAAPVTVVTAGPPRGRAGLTVSSLVIVEGEEPALFFLLGPVNDLWDAISDTGWFVVHVLERRHRALSDIFAGYRPSPGGPFTGLAVTDGPYGPELDDVATRAYCRYTGHRDLGPLYLVEGAVESVAVSDITEPLQYFRGHYLGLVIDPEDSG